MHFFNRMIDDCKAGNIDMIITKSISRFSGNTVDMLQTIRLLKEKGVTVWFEKENIELKGKNHSISIADRMKKAKQKASQQTKETKKLQKDIPQR